MPRYTSAASGTRGAQWIPATGQNGIYREAVLASRPRLARFPDAEVRADPAGSARKALRTLLRAVDHIIVHFDVDAVDSRDLPLANFPHYGTGVSLAAAGAALRVFLQVPQLTAVVLTEINPSYEPSGRSLSRYADTIAQALATRLA